VTEFSRVVSVARLPAGGAHYDISANEAERAALAVRFGLVAIDRLAADVRLFGEAGGVRLEARLEADIVQECVVSLTKFEASAVDSFGLLYRTEEKAEREIDISPEDDIEILCGDEIDIGEAVAQQLSLVLDPHPRAPGVDAGPLGNPAENEDPLEVKHPFAKLAALKSKN